MPKPNPNDISIGKDQWIQYIDITAGMSHAEQIDPLLKPLEPFVIALETNCVAACCGIDAFSLWRDDIQKACQTIAPSELELGLRTLFDYVATSPNEVFVSRRLNQIFHRTVLLKLVEHLRSHSKQT